MLRPERYRSTLAVAMKEAGVSRQEMADALGLSPRTIDSYVPGATLPQRDNALKLAQLLGTTLEALWPGLTESDFTQRHAAPLRHPEAAHALRLARLSRRLAQKEVAWSIGVSESSYGNYERGLTVPKLQVAAKLEQLFDIDMAALYPGRRLKPTIQAPPGSDASRLKLYRQRAGLSGAELANRLTTHATTISNYERGVNRVPYELRLAYAQALGVVPEVLWQDDGRSEEWQEPAAIAHSGQAIKVRRIAMKLSRKQLAERCGISRCSIAKWEREDQRPTFKGMHRTLSALDLSWAEAIDNPRDYPAKSGARVRAFRQSAGLTLQEVADQLELSKSRLGQIEQRRRYKPSRQTGWRMPSALARIAEVLDVSLAELWGEEDGPSS